MDELAFLPATEQARLVREGEVSPVELVETYLERIERLDPELGAFVTVCGEQALADARAKADAPAETPFHGVPIALKDLDTTAGIRTTFSCRAFAENVPDFDLAHVARTRAAGFVVLGKTNTPEFGTTAFTDSPLNGPCRTPWDLGRNAGGSSGGAAAARRGRARARSRRARTAAARSGSRPRAAALFGIKASRGRVSNAPFVPGIGLGTAGAAGADDADAAAYLDLVTGYEWGDPFPAAAAGAALRGGDRRRSGPAAGRAHDRGADRRRRSIPPASPLPARPPSCSPRSATTSRRLRPTGAARS